MPRKKIGKKRFGSKKSKSKNLLLFFVVIISFFSIFVTVNQLQKNQTLKQHAETQTTQISKPVWGCLGLGPSDVCTTVGNTFVSDPNQTCLKNIEARLSPTRLEQGQVIVGIFSIVHACNQGKQIPQLVLKAKHTSGKTIEFSPRSDPKLLLNQTLNFTTQYQLPLDMLTGEWNATLYAPGPNNTDVPFATQSSNLRFTVLARCTGLQVSRALTINRGRVNVGDVIEGTITYRNPCARPYQVKDMLIQVRKPGNGNSTTIEDFGVRSGPLALTLQPGEQKVITSTMIIPSNPCGTRSSCEWAAFGSYQRIDNSWDIDSRLAIFTVNDPQPDPQTPLPAQQGGSTARFPRVTILFVFDQTDIRQQYITTLNDIAQFMKAHPNTRVRLDGHTDDIGSTTYGVDLGRRRAEAIRTYLVGRGIATNRFTVATYGEERPTDTNTTPEGRARNRRVEIYVP